MQAFKFLKKINVPYADWKTYSGSDMHNQVKNLSGHQTFPAIFLGNQLIGGYSELLEARSSGKLKRLLDQAGVNYKL